MTAQRHIRFEDRELQSAFIRALDRAQITYTLDSMGAVLFGETDANAVTQAAHQVRDAQFPWYFLKWKTEPESARFRAALAQAGLPFFVEQHESGTWFLVRRADRAQHDQLWPGVPDETGEYPRT
ncbi:MAG: hypothetical protein DMF49_10895 [Acidobacteria bacterium]|nr:MAG: hypothetical protein DMF49_10895 [Acidobacteriota bacterium]